MAGLTALEVFAMLGGISMIVVGVLGLSPWVLAFVHRLQSEEVTAVPSVATPQAAPSAQPPVTPAVVSAPLAADNDRDALVEELFAEIFALRVSVAALADEVRTLRQAPAAPRVVRLQVTPEAAAMSPFRRAA